MIRKSRSRELPFIIQSKTVTVDGAGDPLTTWTDGTKIWCSVKPLNDREVLALGGQLNEYWFELTTKYINNLTHIDRLRTTNATPTYYSIESIKDPIGDRMMLKLKVKISSPNELAAT